MLLYATADEVHAATSDTVDDVEPLLRAASRLVRSATRHDLYATTPTGMPAPGTDVAEAMRDATVAQVMAWHGANVDPARGSVGQDTPVASSSINGATVAYAVSPDADRRRAELATSLAPEAWDVLRSAGLGSAGTTVISC